MGLVGLVVVVGRGAAVPGEVCVSYLLLLIGIGIDIDISYPVIGYPVV
jgi:hypothetical protein